MKTAEQSESVIKPITKGFTMPAPPFSESSLLLSDVINRVSETAGGCAVARLPNFVLLVAGKQRAKRRKWDSSGDSRGRDRHIFDISGHSGSAGEGRRWFRESQNLLGSLVLLNRLLEGIFRRFKAH